MIEIWITRLITFLLWAWVAGTATFWTLQNRGAGANNSDIVSAASTTPALTQASPVQEANLVGKIALALGAKTPAAESLAGGTGGTAGAVQARLQLQGVLSVNNKSGAALIAVDGKPAKPYRVGSVVDSGWELLSVEARSATIGQNQKEAFTLEMPKQSVAATGSPADGAVTLAKIGDKRD